MYTDFKNMPGHSRVWIYQSDRKLTEENKEMLTLEAKSFCSTWTAHNNNLKASFKIFYDHFFVLTVDEAVSGASGCSIDKSVHFVNTLEGKLGVSFFNRELIPFLMNEEICLIHFRKVKEAITNGDIDEDTTTFDNLVPTIEALKGKWMIKAGDSWLSRYFKRLAHPANTQ